MIKTKAPLVSIVVAIYNVEAYLDRCLESAVNQSYEMTEIILVDDGSTDLSGEICDTYAEKSTRIKVVHKKNGGLVSARKAGIAKAEGKYIGFLDGDDYIDRDMVKELVENIEETDADFVHSGYCVCGRKISCFDNIVTRLDCNEDKEEFIRKYVLAENNTVSPSIVTKLFKADLIKKCYNLVPDTQEVGEDLINLMECIMQSNKISFLNAANYHYMIRQGSLTNLEGIESLMWQSGLYLAIKDILLRYGCYEQVKKYLDCYFVGTIWQSLEKKFESQFLMTRYLFRNIELVANKKIVLYGAGNVGRDYYTQLSCCANCVIVAWIDNNYQNINYDNYMKVVGRESLKFLEYDYVVIAVMHQEQAEEIKATLERENVDSKKLLYSTPIDVCYCTREI